MMNKRIVGNCLWQYINYDSLYQITLYRHTYFTDLYRVSVKGGDDVFYSLGDILILDNWGVCMLDDIIFLEDIELVEGWTKSIQVRVRKVEERRRSITVSLGWLIDNNKEGEYELVNMLDECKVTIE